MERSEVAAKLAERFGWTFMGKGWIMLLDALPLRFPPPDAPLHEHLAFVGRVLEAVLAEDDGLTAMNAINAVHEVLSVAVFLRVAMPGAPSADPSLAVALAVIDTPTKETP